MATWRDATDWQKLGAIQRLPRATAFNKGRAALVFKLSIALIVPGAWLTSIQDGVSFSTLCIRRSQQTPFGSIPSKWLQRIASAFALPSPAVQMLTRCFCEILRCWRGWLCYKSMTLCRSSSKEVAVLSLSPRPSGLPDRIILQVLR